MPPTTSLGAQNSDSELTNNPSTAVPCLALPFLLRARMRGAWRPWQNGCAMSSRTKERRRLVGIRECEPMLGAGRAMEGRAWCSVRY